METNQKPRFKTLRNLICALILILFAIVGCAATAVEGAKDPLPSWNEGAAKQAILRFVKGVTEKSGSNYIPPEDRIATFDNDGTLWVEKPTACQGFFLFKRIDDMAEDHPEWKTEQPFKAVLERDFDYLEHLKVEEILKLLAVTHTGMTQEEFEKDAKAFLDTAKHPRFKVPFTQLVYQPMLELLAYLQENNFRVFIVSGGGIDFMRTFSEEVYGIPRENIIGSAFQTEFKMVDNKPVLIRLPDFVQPIDDKAGKPVNIQRYIGRRPVLACGNSDGDIQMMQFAESDTRPFLSILIHHDDAEREYAYTSGTENALKLAGERGWTTVYIKSDFKTVFKVLGR